MKPQVISFRCVLKNKAGNVISSTFNRDVMTHCPGDPLPDLSKGLDNLKAGEERQIVLAAPQAYGFYDPDLVIEISRKKIPRGIKLKVGDEIVLHFQGKNPRKFRLIHENSRMITLDGNHPLAGQDLIFHVEGVQLRDASEEEIEETRVEGVVRRYH